MVFFCLFFFIGSYDIPPIVSGVVENSPAQRAGIQVDDKVLEVNGKKIIEWADISREVSIAPETVELLIERNGEKIKLMLKTEAMDYAFDETEKPLKRKMIGIKGEAKRFKVTKDNFNFVSSVKKSALEIYNVTEMSLRGIGQIITGQRSGDEVGGIIRIAEMSGDISKSRGFWDFISFMALLSINLGLINLFPIPLLDGGHVVIYLLEIISRRELNAKIKDVLLKIGLGFILFLMVFATWNDIKHLITRWFE
jgi:regulator of sigma E protease